MRESMREHSVGERREESVEQRAQVDAIRENEWQRAAPNTSHFYPRLEM